VIAERFSDLSDRLRALGRAPRDLIDRNRRPGGIKVPTRDFR